MTDALIEVKNLKKHFSVKKGFLRKRVGVVKAVDDISFTIGKGEMVGLVGESGCGKTTTGRLLVKLLESTDGEIIYNHKTRGSTDVNSLNKKELWELRRGTQMVFQDPYSSLNPRMTVQELVQEPLICYRIGTPSEQRETVVQTLKTVGLDPRFMTRYPHAFSGGQRQRISIARCLVLNPELVIADEPVSALDVSVQAQILNLLQDLQADFGLTMLLISHDLAVVNHLCDRIIVMYSGKIMEIAQTAELFANPLHPYVEILLSAVPRPEAGFRFENVTLKNDAEELSLEQGGCNFKARCKYAEKICFESEPELRTVGQGDSSHLVSCHFAETLDLRGII